MSTGYIALPTASARAIFTQEILGQMSDGYWENSGPHDHFRFWCGLEVREGAPTVFATGWCKKNNYGLTRLIEYVGDRMVKIGKFAAIGAEGVSSMASEYMPATLEEFRQCKSTNTWKYDHVAKYMENVTDEIAVKFYASTYDMKAMKDDLKLIKEAMKKAR